MKDKMAAPELFRPPLDFPAIPYDRLLRDAAGRHPDRPAIICFRRCCSKSHYLTCDISS
jgi:hypothetical protein